MVNQLGSRVAFHRNHPINLLPSPANSRQSILQNNPPSSPPLSRYGRHRSSQPYNPPEHRLDSLLLTQLNSLLLNQTFIQRDTQQVSHFQIRPTNPHRNLLFALHCNLLEILPINRVQILHDLHPSNLLLRRQRILQNFQRSNLQGNLLGNQLKNLPINHRRNLLRNPLDILLHSQPIFHRFLHQNNLLNIQLGVHHGSLPLNLLFNLRGSLHGIHLNSPIVILRNNRLKNRLINQQFILVVSPPRSQQLFPRRNHQNFPLSDHRSSHPTNQWENRVSNPPNSRRITPVSSHPLSRIANPAGNLRRNLLLILLFNRRGDRLVSQLNNPYEGHLVNQVNVPVSSLFGDLQCNPL